MPRFDYNHRRMRSLRNLSANSTTFVVLASLFAFFTYFCAFGFRKAFTAADFAGAEANPLGLDFKIALLIAQVLGYGLAKFIGIKLIAELRARYRLALLLACVLVAQIALIGFGLTQDSAWSLWWLFLNGFPLGMVWGIVFGYLEGRRTTEILGSVLCASFIVSSGAVKSVGVYLMQSWLVSPYWMPALVGALFLPVITLFAWLLHRLPPPSPEDERARTPRAPMDGARRRELFQKLWLGLIAIIAYYVLLTAYRDVRDNFAVEIWDALGYGNKPSIFTISELPIAVITLVALGLTTLVRNNRRAMHLYHALLIGSTLLIVIATYAFQAGLLAGSVWMVLMGAGLYLGYVPMNAIFFDRLIAAFRYVATAGFLIYVADAAGYMGSISVLLYRNFGQAELDWLPFFIGMSYWMGIAGTAFVALAWWDFHRRLTKVGSGKAEVGERVTVNGLRPTE